MHCSVRARVDRAGIERQERRHYARLQQLGWNSIERSWPLLKGWPREKRGFNGVIISDYTAIGGLIQHGLAADEVEAAAIALKAGVDGYGQWKLSQSARGPVARPRGRDGYRRRRAQGSCA